MFEPEKFNATSTRPLPIVLILDNSLSMSEKISATDPISKIDTLNKAIEEMLESLIEEESLDAEFLVSVITFGGKANLKIPFTSATQISWHPLDVEGKTPLGEAIELAKNMIESKEKTPTRAYRPTVVLVSDGKPTDGIRWEKAMDSFINEGRSSKCDRMAMAIGNAADEKVLEYFIRNTQHELFYAEDAVNLSEFFQRVTMSVTLRSRSHNPNMIPSNTDIEMEGKNDSTTRSKNDKQTSIVNRNEENSEDSFW